MDTQRQTGRARRQMTYLPASRRNLLAAHRRCDIYIFGENSDGP